MMPGIWARIAFAIGLWAIGFIFGYALEAKFKGAEIAALKAEYATEKEKSTAAALSDLRATSAAIHQAAVNYTDSTKDLEIKINAIRIEIKKARPLPADCKPGDVRLLNIRSAINQANVSP